LIKFFSLDNVGSSAAVFNPEKLLWLNSQYIMNTPPERLAELVIPFLVKAGLISEGQHLDMQWLSKAVLTLRERARTLVELALSMKYYLLEEIDIDQKAKEKFLKPEGIKLLTDLRDALEGLAEFTVPEIEKVFASLVEKHGIKLGSLAQPARVAITGGTASPGIFEVFEVIGKRKVLKRLEKVIGAE
jgi:glutamyl-tRNA synthetase